MNYDYYMSLNNKSQTFISIFFQKEIFLYVLKKQPLVFKIIAINH